MVESADLLVEIGTEEMPPKSLRVLSETFGEELIKELENCGLSSQAYKVFATPRRLAVQVNGLPLKQEDQLIERKGPALSAAFDAQGNPTRAALGFARSCGVEVKALQKLETAKGAWLMYHMSKMGKPTIALLPELIEQTLTRLPIPRRMRWGSGDTEFVRPAHWVVFLLDDQVVDTPILGLKPGRESHGHRFHHPGPIRISKPAQYAELLQRQGKVLADFELRRDKIRSQVEQLAQQFGGQALLDNELLDEVTSLVEWPQALAGSFAEEFLNIPQEVLISTMQDNQKYFPMLDMKGKLLPHFIIISNIESRYPQKVLEGNERVIRPRFRDAEFFWQQDCKTTLASRRQALKDVVFQHRLGSLYDKSQRLIPLTQIIARLTDVDTGEARRAAELCKCDLLTNMVNEFPKLQGIMGRYYARHDGETAEVAASLDEHYMPRQAGGTLPHSGIGRCLAIADRLDTLLGIFTIGQRPTGVKDPYALRRAALGVLRIVIECRLELDLQALLLKTAEGFPEGLGAHKAVTEVFDYIMERLRAYYLDRGMTSDAFEAVLACHPLRPLDFDRRIHAVVKFRALPEAASLSQTNKRIRNILKQANGEIPTQVQNQLLQEPAEQELNELLGNLSLEVEPLFDKGEYEQGLLQLAGLRRPVDRFFDEVMVMVDEYQLRTNRIALLNRLSQLFLRTADLSRLQN